MTLKEIKGFLKAIAKDQIEQRAVFLHGIAVGAQCDSKVIKKTLKDYEKFLTRLDES